MKAVGYQRSLPIDQPDSLMDIELPKPSPGAYDLLVKVEAISVNPVDTKIRKRMAPGDDSYQVLGWDVAGTVEAVGSEVSTFSVGQNVWYAGALDRPGANAEFHRVDARIVSTMPASLTFAQAAALPLTSITAWELLFDRFGFSKDSHGTLLIVGAAGGVGSVMIQLAKKLTGLTVIGTASRPSTIDWIQSLGVDHVINHRNPLGEELKAIGFDSVDHVAGLTHTDEHLHEYPDILAPQGSFGVIDDADVLDIMPFKKKSISIHWELMFTRSLFKTDDMQQQGELLAKVAQMVDAGELKTTVAEEFGTICADNLKRAHALLESGTSMGKIVLSGF